MRRYALVLEPRESSVVHHCIDLRNHGIKGAYADFSPHLIPHFVSSSTGPLLFDDSAGNLPGFVSYAIGFSHDNH